MTPQQVYQWLVVLVATLPNTRVTLTWGEPHFRVGDKIFGGWGAHKDGRYLLSAKLDKDKQAALVASDPRFQVAPYVGKHGWVAFQPGDDPDLGELEALVLESYRLIAPAKLVAQLPAAKASKPLAKAGKPLAKAGKPLAKAGKPAAKAGKPMAKASKPVAKANKPMAKVNKPMAKVNKPLAKAGKPVAKANKPVARARRASR
jgi:predicted DNA-binding protein (MmcQ/YjbR family)